MEGHPEFQLDMRPADSSPSSSSAAFAAGRPSIGIMSFSGEVFDGTSLNIGDGKAYSKLKRTVTALLCLIMIMGGLLVVILVGYDAHPQWDYQYKSKYDNASIVDLDLNPHSKPPRGICMHQPDQSFMLWMEGDLVAAGGNGCDLDFVGKDLHTPQCSEDMWIAIQAVDSEATSDGGHSRGGIKAAMKWCGMDVITDMSWECSTVGESGWQKPVANGFDPGMQVEIGHGSARSSQDCFQRELPTCSWVQRTLRTLNPMNPQNEPLCSGPNPNGEPKALCIQKFLNDDCKSRTSINDCIATDHSSGTANPNLRVHDAYGRGVCKWVPADGDTSCPLPLGTCELDLSCTHFRPAKEADDNTHDLKHDLGDSVSNVMDNKDAKWIWVDTDEEEWLLREDIDETEDIPCSGCGHPENNCPSAGACESFDPICKWDTASEICIVEDAPMDEDTVYCRKHVTCEEMKPRDPVTHELIQCKSEFWRRQRQNMTASCDKCQRCRTLAYQSPGEKATTTDCLEAETQDCTSQYRTASCFDPAGLVDCPKQVDEQTCTNVPHCVYVQELEEEGTSCPEKWGGVFPKMSLNPASEDYSFASIVFYVTLGIFMMSYMFVGFHIICDDFFVPALNVLCEKLGIPDDVAGATFMAAGASSPELFASLIGVITHSAVGAGTVVGSELFNMLCIVGGVCLVTPIPLTLDWRPLAREVFFFTVSLVGILVALADEEVTLAEALVLISGYVAYVAVCAKYKTLMRIFCPSTGGNSDEEFYIDFHLDEPSSADGMSASLSGADAGADLQGQLNGAAFGMEYGDVLMHGFLHKKSDFYSKARISKSVWQKRWVVLDEGKLFYTRKSGKDRVLIASPSTWASSWVRSTTYTEFHLSAVGNDFVFKASTPAVAKKWVNLLSQRIEHAKTLSPASTARADADAEEEHHDGEDYHDLLTVPDSPGGKAFYYFVYPMLLAFSFSIPDVRKPGNSNWYPVTMMMSVVLMALMANVMMTGAEYSGCLLGIPEDVMGLTVTAAGTSLPNLFASLMVAKQGLGNMAVSNAFGSNTFNIFVALAVPWLVGTILHGQSEVCPSLAGNKYTYHVTAGKIGTSCIILGAVLAMMVTILVVTNMKLTKEVGYFFNVVYAVIIGWLVVS